MSWLKVAISYVSVADAQANLAAEQTGWNYPKVASDATAAWNKLLNEAQIGGGTPDEQASFYTALYGSLLDPTLLSDDNGKYPGFDGQVHTLGHGQAQYSTFSGWDIYRSEVPLLTLVNPDVSGQMMASLVRDAQQGGWLPVWQVVGGYTGVMNGDSSDPILAEGYAFGASNRDSWAPAALQAMVKGATQAQTPADLGQGYYIERPGLASELQLGYVPNTFECCTSATDVGASATLEYSQDDYAIAALAQDLGQQGTYQSFAKSSQDWENLFDPENGYILPRDGDGAFPSGAGMAATLSGSDNSGYQEGDASQYDFEEPQNLAALVAGLGGDASTIDRLNQFFSYFNLGGSNPDYYAGNETDLEAPWVYDYAGAPYLTQKTVRDIIDTVYEDVPGGEPGNDDLGAMDSWEVWAMLGMYPETPGAPDLALGSPLFPYTALHFEGHTTVISAPGASDASPYVRSLTVNGAPTSTPGSRSPTWPAGAPPCCTSPSAARPTGTGAASPPTRRRPSALARPSRWPASATLTCPWPRARAPPSGHRAEHDQPAAVRGGHGRGHDGQWADAVAAAIALGQARRHRQPPAIRSGDREAEGHGQPAGDGRRLHPDDPAVGARLGPGAGQPVRGRRPGRLAASLFDNVGITSEASPSSGSFDGARDSYPAPQLSSGQADAGRNRHRGRIPFTWSSQAGQPDNVIADGQTLAVPAPAGTAQIGFLGAASAGTTSGVATLTYSDHTTAQYQLGLTNWTATTPAGGNTAAVTTTQENETGSCETLQAPGCGTSAAGQTAIFETSLPVNPAKQLVSVTLPPADGTSATADQLTCSPSGPAPPPGGPVVSSLTPPVAAAGDQVTITGIRFRNGRARRCHAVGQQQHLGPARCRRHRFQYRQLE